MSGFIMKNYNQLKGKIGRPMIVDISWDKPTKPNSSKCPDCNGNLHIRRSYVGNLFYGCSNYPNCKYTKPFEPKPE